MALDDELHNPANNQPRQGQQDDFSGKSVNEELDDVSEEDLDTGCGVAEGEGSVLIDDDSPAGQNVASEDDQDFSGNLEAEDPEVSPEEQGAT